MNIDLFFKDLQMKMFNELLNSFSLLDKSIVHLGPYAMNLFWLLMLIDFMLVILLHLDDGVQMKKMVSKIMKYGIWLYFIRNFSDLTDKILNSFIMVGQIAATGSSAGAVPMMKDPSRIVEMGFEVAAPLMNWSMSSFTGFLTALKHPELIAICGFSMIVIVISFFIIAVQVIITTIEFNIVASLAFILLPFGTNKHTSFLAEKAFGAVIHYGIKFMALSFILSIMMPTVDTWASQLKLLFETNPTNPFLAVADLLVGDLIPIPLDAPPPYKHFLLPAAGSAILAILALNANNIGHAVEQGGSVLSAGTVFGTIGAAAATAATVAATVATGGAGAAAGAGAGAGAGEAGKNVALNKAANAFQNTGKNVKGPGSSLVGLPKNPGVTPKNSSFLNANNVVGNHGVNDAVNDGVNPPEAGEANAINPVAGEANAINPVNAGVAGETNAINPVNAGVAGETNAINPANTGVAGETNAINPVNAGGTNVNAGGTNVNAGGTNVNAGGTNVNAGGTNVNAGGTINTGTSTQTYANANSTSTTNGSSNYSATFSDAAQSYSSQPNNVQPAIQSARELANDIRGLAQDTPATSGIHVPIHQQEG